MKFTSLTLVLMFCFSSYAYADNNVYIAPKASSMNRASAIPPVVDPNMGVVPNDGANYPQSPDVALDDLDPSIGVIPEDAYYPQRPYPPYPQRPNNDGVVYMPSEDGTHLIPYKSNGAFMPPRHRDNPYNDFEYNLYRDLAPCFSLPLPHSKMVISDGQAQKFDNKEDKVHRYEVNKDSVTIGVGKQR